MHLFSSEDAGAMADLDEACAHLEVSMGKMLQVQWGSAVEGQDQRSPEGGREVKEDSNDIWFNHS